jgi:hypothetical protein
MILQIQDLMCARHGMKYKQASERRQVACDFFEPVHSDKPGGGQRHFLPEISLFMNEDDALPPESAQRLGKKPRVNFTAAKPLLQIDLIAYPARTDRFRFFQRGRVTLYRAVGTYIEIVMPA